MLNSINHSQSSRAIICVDGYFNFEAHWLLSELLNLKVEKQLSVFF